MALVSTRQLGKNGPLVSAIGFRAVVLSVSHRTPIPDEERFKVLDRVIELGSTFIDSSDGYGDNEDLLGKYFQKYLQQREKVSEINFEKGIYVSTMRGNIAVRCAKFCLEPQIFCESHIFYEGK